MRKLQHLHLFDNTIGSFMIAKPMLRVEMANVEISDAKSLASFIPSLCLECFLKIVRSKLDKNRGA